MKPQQTPRRLLLVDDDSRLLATFGNELMDAGYQVLMADSAEKGLGIIDKVKPPELAILKICMPEMSGIEMVQRLKAQHIAWIFISAYNDDRYVKQAVQEGALGYLVKPLEVAQAIPAIEVALHLAQQLMQCQESEKRLSAALETGNQVNVAIGVLMERNRMSRQDAYELLRQKARTEQRKVRAVAEELLSAWDSINLLSASRK